MTDARSVPRFPYAAALVWALCLCLMAYLWMTHSYAWPVRAEDLQHQFESTVQNVMAEVRAEKRRWGTHEEIARFHALPRPYLSVRGTIAEGPTEFEAFGQVLTTEAGPVVAEGRCHVLLKGCTIDFILPPDAQITPDREQVLCGRIRYGFSGREVFSPASLDTTASRFTWHSILGLSLSAVATATFGYLAAKWARRRWSGRRETA